MALALVHVLCNDQKMPAIFLLATLFSIIAPGKFIKVYENVQKKRISVYKNETLAVADHYNQFGKVETLNGLGEIETIFSGICAAIEAKS